MKLKFGLEKDILVSKSIIEVKTNALKAEIFKDIRKKGIEQLFAEDVLITTEKIAIFNDLMKITEKLTEDTNILCIYQKFSLIFT